MNLLERDGCVRITANELVQTVSQRFDVNSWPRLTKRNSGHDICAGKVGSYTTELQQEILADLATCPRKSAAALPMFGNVLIEGSEDAVQLDWQRGEG